MKMKLLFLFVLCCSITTVYSNTQSYKKVPIEKQINTQDTLNLWANIVFPVKISFSTLGGVADDIEMKIFNQDTTVSVSHFTKHVTAQTDTIIYLMADKYTLVWIQGGALLQNPKLLGKSVSVSLGGWAGGSNGLQLPFKVIDYGVVCEGETFLNATTYFTGKGKLKYKWTPSTGLSNDTIANPIATLTSAITYNVTVTAPSGITATKDIIVNVNPLLANAGMDQTIICGGTLQLNNVTTNYTGVGKLKYKWDPSTGLNNDTIANPIANILSDITYTVTVTASAGCTATDDVKVTVKPFTVNAGLDRTAISGSTLQMNSVTTNYTGTGKLKYKWTPSTGLNNDTIANPIASVFSNIIYSISVTAPTGCTSTDNVALTITPMSKPEIGIVGVNSTNKNVIAWNKQTSTGIASYSIYKETTVSDVYDKIGSVSYDSLSVFIDNQSTANVKSNKYKMSIIDRSGLESEKSNAHKTMHLTISKGQNNTWNLIWEPYEGFTTSTYNIYRGNSVNSLNFLDATSGSSTQYSDIAVAYTDVYYQLEVVSPALVTPTKITFSKSKDSEKSTSSLLTSYNSSRSNIASNVVSGINELSENAKITIYPNPIKEELKIDYAGGSTFEILNLMGQVVYNGDLSKNTTVQTSSYSTGVYLIRFKTGNTFEYKKVIKD